MIVTLIPGGAIIALFKPTDHPMIPTADVYLDALVRSKSSITTAFPTFVEVCRIARFIYNFALLNSGVFI